MVNVWVMIIAKFGNFFFPLKQMEILCSLFVVFGSLFHSYFPRLLAARVTPATNLETHFKEF